MPFYQFGCSYVMLYNFQNAGCSFWQCLFCEYCFEIINYYMHYVHVLQMSCMWIKDGVHLNLIVGRSVGCQLNCLLFPYLKVVGYPLSCPLSCPLYPYMAVVGSLICMAKFPWAAHGQPTPLPTELPTFSCLEVVCCPLSCSLFPYMEVVDSLICMAKFPWAAHSAAHFFIFEVVGCLLSCPLSCPLFPYMEVVGSLICMAKFPWAAHGQPTPLPTCSPWAAKWAVPLFFPYGYPSITVRFGMIQKVKIDRLIFFFERRGSFGW